MKKMKTVRGAIDIAAIPKPVKGKKRGARALDPDNLVALANRIQRLTVRLEGVEELRIERRKLVTLMRAQLRRKL